VNAEDQVTVSRFTTVIEGKIAELHDLWTASFTTPDKKLYSMCNGYGDSVSEAIKDLYRAYETYQHLKEMITVDD
jgi:hypothetical protein